MMPPTATFEPEEFALSPKRDVPVVRFFGPILRRILPEHNEQEIASVKDAHFMSDDKDALANEEVPQPRPYYPQQSACLYVHGAFPYLLARPVAAGPDGSGRADCPWESVTSVQRMIPVLTEALETALQETSAAFANSSSATAAATTTAPRDRDKLPTVSRVLRRITVVTGRGFYTYCPGPAAPFLRVEYYCPADRWKVKRCLEHGLPLEPLSLFHPWSDADPLDDSGVAGGEVEEVRLRFHCYEAHIPYTMQLFKDWNLAGLSYIHVASSAVPLSAAVKFRHPLPPTIRQRYRSRIHSNERGSAASNASRVARQSAFLASNTPAEYTWNSMTAEGKAFPTLDALKDPASVLASNFLQKMTSCDVELDIGVSSILNVRDVMTDLPDAWEERQQIHWRAVPSLREIWSQERRRMAKLLKPKDDFLSGMDMDEADESAAPPFTLNVKRDAPLSGSRLAAEGMHRLLQVTEGLEENFRRAMKEIVHRHSQSISQSDARLRQERQRLQTRLQLRTPPGIDKDVSFETREENLTPSNDEAIEALDALHELFETTESLECDTNDNGMPPSSQTENNLSYSSQVSSTASDRLILSLSQACASSAEKTVGSLHDEFRLSQCVERGDGLVDSRFHSVDDVIDPETLTPYEAFDDEDDADSSMGEDDVENLEEHRVERLLSTLATQEYMSTGRELSGNNDPSPDDSSVESLALFSGNRSKDILFEAEDDASVDEASATMSNQMCTTGEAANELYGSKQYLNWQHPPDISIEYRGAPPMRGDVAKLDGEVSLYPIGGQGSTPWWASFTSDYNATRHTLLNNHWFPVLGYNSVDVCPVEAAPSRKTVIRWDQKRAKNGLKRSRSFFESFVVEKCESRKGISSNTCDVASSSKKNKSTQVEEVVWRLSQESSAALSQDRGEAREPDDSSSPSAEKHSQGCSTSLDSASNTPLEAPTQGRSPTGIGNQGGRILVEGGGDLKAITKQTQIDGGRQGLDSAEGFPLAVSMMTIEVYVQCRTARAGVNDSRTIALTPVADRDKIYSVVYVLCRDPGGGEPFEFLERGCIFIPIDREMENKSQDTTLLLHRFANETRKSLPTSTFGVAAPVSIECVRDERQLLLRLASIVRWKDPDMLLSWDTQGAGLGYLIERGIALGKEDCADGSVSKELDMARLLGRTPTVSSRSDLGGQQSDRDDAGGAALAGMNRFASAASKPTTATTPQWKGSGLGTEWDERVGAGAAASSIVSNKPLP
jgi:hypothetical protein